MSVQALVLRFSHEQFFRGTMSLSRIFIYYQYKIKIKRLSYQYTSLSLSLSLNLSITLSISFLFFFLQIKSIWIGWCTPVFWTWVQCSRKINDICVFIKVQDNLFSFLQNWFFFLFSFLFFFSFFRNLFLAVNQIIQWSLPTGMVWNLLIILNLIIFLNKGN